MSKAANGSSKMSSDLNFGFPNVEVTDFSGGFKSGMGDGEELETVSLDNFLKDFWCKSEERHGS